MKNISSILQKVGATSSRLEKEAILTEFKDNEVLKNVFRLAHDKQVLFYTRHIPDDLIWGSNPLKCTLAEALRALEDKLCSRTYTGGRAEAFLNTLFSNVEYIDAEVLRLVILRDLRIGATASTANKIWPGLIDLPKFMLASTTPEDIVYPATSQLKEDGARAKFIWAGGKVSMFSRNGNEIETCGAFDKWAEQNLKEDAILDGEMVVVRDGKRADRKTGNGIVNKAVRGTISPEEAQELAYMAWDIDSLDVGYAERFAHLTTIVEGGDIKDKVILVESKVVNSYEEALEHFKDLRRRGFEGSILKNSGAKWQPKRTKDLAKFKAEIEGEFKVVGVQEGTGKNVGKCGALLIESQDGKVTCNVGIFKDFDQSIRDEWWTNPPKVVTVLYNERIKAKGSPTFSLFLPRVTAARYDKDEANTLEELEAIEKAILV